MLRLIFACTAAVCGFSNVKAFWTLREKILALRKKGRAGVAVAKMLMPFCSVIRRRYGCGIPVTEDIKPFLTPHAFHGIFISEYAVVETGCTIFQQVTIGQNGLINVNAEGGNAPHIGKNCYIGAGAKVIGPCRVGENVRIGANAIVVDNVPDDTTVVLQKPRIIIRENDGTQ